ncbi:hypothetical protein FRAHR75_1870003 [Frankia sp. Hr75.2]|nr:hypothetical protein FRAHR75_1870003 [Frankia sp. Hr75.2]
MPPPAAASHGGDRHGPTSAPRTGHKAPIGRLGTLAANAAYITTIAMALVTLLGCAPPRQAAAETGFPRAVVGSGPVRTTDPAEGVGSIGMTKADEPVREHVQETTAVYDHGQFYLYTDVWDEIDPVQIIHDAINTDGVAQGGPLLVVLSPHQCNFAVTLRVERWSAQPAGDLDAWQEAFSASIDVDEFGLLYESTTTIQNLRLEVPAGRYTALITGRGFVHRGWPGSTMPGDEWRVQLWPRDGAHREPARLKAWAG